jgi:hypothetical protein
MYVCMVFRRFHGASVDVNDQNSTCSLYAYDVHSTTAFLFPHMSAAAF